jgi:hypothetical protein
MTKVKCTVNSCDFWGEGQVCKAHEIQVNSNAITGDAGMEIGADFDRQALQNMVAQTSPQTCCETMRPKK